MLGERRSNSLFAPAAPAKPERKPEQAEVHDISFEERTGRSLFAETATAPRASELFFAPQEKGITFAEALSQVQGYLSETYATLITEDNSDAKEQMKRRMTRYLQENRIAVDGMTASELVDALYTEMAEYGFLTKYIFADGIEEIDINSWRDIEIQYSDGHTAKLEEHFDSPEHAANVIRRMLQNSGKVLDNLIKHRGIARDVVAHFAKAGLLYEDAEYHNAVFVGTDVEGVPRHAHKRSANSYGKAFRLNIEGSDPRYSFHYVGTGRSLYVFEAPIDMLSFITLYPENWQRHSYVACCGTSIQPVLQMLEQVPQLDTVLLCLDNDEAGHQASRRMQNQLEVRYSVERLIPENKDWNDDLTLNSENAQGLAMNEMR